MKLNKLVIAMGLASVALTACNSSSGTEPAAKADFTITAIDGYIINGTVIATCGESAYKARTNTQGVAELLAEGNKIGNCTAVISGDEETYDADVPGVPWQYTMNTLPGLSIINPFTDVAVTLSQVAANEGLSNEALKNKVLGTLGFDDNNYASAILFDDFAADTISEDEQGVAFLAQGVFDATVEANRELGEKNSAANLASLFDNVLEVVQESVTAQIEKTIKEGNKLSDSVITVVVTLPDLDFSEDDTIKIENLKYLAVGSATQEKSELTDPVKVAEVTRSAAKDAEENAEAAVAAAPAAEKIARQAVTAKAVVKKVEAQQVVAEKAVAKAEAALATVALAAKAEAEAELEAAKALVNVVKTSKEVAENSAKVAKDTVSAEKTFNNATGEDKAAAKKALDKAKDAAEAAEKAEKAAEKATEKAEKAAEKAAEAAEKAAEKAENATGADSGGGNSQG